MTVRAMRQRVQQEPGEDETQNGNFSGFGGAFRPFDEQPLFVMRVGAPVVAMGGT